MKNIVLAIALIFATTAYAAEAKKVCVDQTDAKTKQTKQVCKTVKQHKKLEPAKTPVVPVAVPKANKPTDPKAK